MKSRIGIIGSGVVGQTLARGFIAHGHEVMIGTNDVRKHGPLREATGGKAGIGSFTDTARFGQIVVLATKGTAAEAALRIAGTEHLAGKTVIDTTNPIADAPPDKGVLRFFTTLNESLMERLQRVAPEARFVKAFSCVGNAFMVNPDFGGVMPTMFICGNDGGAKAEVTEICTTFGHETEDMGSVEAARAIEPLCILWCIPGLLHNRWTHAFKLLKK
jgi:8-hydroxy-5-deazaflavin:NADPH oxidoreductase